MINCIHTFQEDIPDIPDLSDPLDPDYNVEQECETDEPDEPAPQAELPATIKPLNMETWKEFIPPALAGHGLWLKFFEEQLKNCGVYRRWGVE